MGVIHDQIAAEVAARDGLIAAAGVGRLHLLPFKDRARIKQKTLNIRRIRNQAAASLGIIPSFEVQKFGKTFRVDAFKPNEAGWDFWHPGKRVHQIYLQATCLDTGEVHVWNGAKKERLQCPNMPTGIYSDKVIGTDELGEPIFEIAEDPLAAALSHFKHAALLGISEEVATDAVSEWGSTTTVACTEAGNVADSPMDAYYNVRNGATIWQTLVDAAGYTHFPTSATGYLAHWRANASANSFQDLNRGVTIFPKLAVIGSDIVSGAVVSLMIYNKADGNADTPSLIGSEFTPPSSTSVPGWAAKANYGAEITSKAYADVAASSSAYNDFTIAAGGLDWINANDLFAMGWRMSYDASEVAPTDGTYGEAQFICYFADQAGTNKDPKVTYTHASAAAASNPTGALIGCGAI